MKQTRLVVLVLVIFSIIPLVLSGFTEEMEYEGYEDTDWKEVCYYWTVPYDMTEAEFEEKFGPEVYSYADSNGFNTVGFVGPYIITVDEPTVGSTDTNAVQELVSKSW